MMNLLDKKPEEVEEILRKDLAELREKQKRLEEGLRVPPEMFRRWITI